MNRHERRVVGQGIAQPVGRQDAARVEWQDGGFPPPPGQRLEGIEHGFVLDAAGNQMLTTRHLEGFGRPPNREIVGLGPSAREDDLGWFGADEAAHSAPGDVDRSLCLLSIVMNARCIAEKTVERVDHRLRGHGIDRGRGIVIEVDAHVLRPC
jgi:hypothetical protein